MSKISAVAQRPSRYASDEHHEHDHSSADNGPNILYSAQDQLSFKRKRNQLRESPDSETEVVILSPESLMTTNRFVCESCGKGFPRDQNLQLHLRQHNLPWKLNTQQGKHVDGAGSNNMQLNNNLVQSRKRVYICPEESCVHHHWSRALGDLTGIKKHFSRKHGERKWKCDKCWKTYAVQSDLKAHTKICGNREFLCDSCELSFTRKDKFSKHRDYCKALAQEKARVTANVDEGEMISDIGTARLALGAGSSPHSECTSSASSGQQLTPNSSGTVEGISTNSTPSSGVQEGISTPPSLHINDVLRPTVYEQRVISTSRPGTSSWLDVDHLNKSDHGSGGINSTPCAALSLWPIGDVTSESNGTDHNDLMQQQQLAGHKRATPAIINHSRSPVGQFASSWGLGLPEVQEPADCSSNTAIIVESYNSTTKPSNFCCREMKDSELSLMDELDAARLDLIPKNQGRDFPNYNNSALTQLLLSSRGQLLLQVPHDVSQQHELAAIDEGGPANSLAGNNLSSPLVLSMLTDPYLLYSTSEKVDGLKERVTRDFLGVGG